MLKILVYFAIFFAIPVATSFLPLDEFTRNSLAVLILFLLTWLLYKKEGKTLAALGLTLKAKTLRFLPLGLLVGILFFCVLLFFQKIYNGLSITLNPHADYTLIATGLLLALPGVLMEELIFRGYCLHKAVYQAGPVKANLLFAFFFIVWHWLAFNAWGNVGLMLSLMTTGFGHILFAAALGRSKTLFFPIAIHLGNNWASRYLFALNMGGIVDPKKASNSLFLTSAQPTQFSNMHVVGGYLISITCFIICTAMILLLFRKKAAPEHTRQS
ncbi:MAG: CPBP family intramembrane glutamic endopeptidase [Bacteroidota bacterium]